MKNVSFKLLKSTMLKQCYHVSSLMSYRDSINVTKIGHNHFQLYFQSIMQLKQHVNEY